MEAQHSVSTNHIPDTLDRMLNPKPVRFALLITVSLVVIAILSGCDAEPRKTDAELGLTPQQASGRRVYDARCGDCHYAYSKRNLRGPSLSGSVQETVPAKRNARQ